MQNGRINGCSKLVARGGWQRGLEPSLHDRPSNAPVKKFDRVGLCTNFIPNKHGGGEEGELAELAVIWYTRVCVGSALFPLF